MNCHRNYPWYRDWARKFAEEEVQIVGIHTPETQAERDEQKLAARLEEAELRHPVLIDNQKAAWNAWGNSMWPTTYLVDKQGNLRYWWYGELDWQGAGAHLRMEQRIKQLLAEPTGTR